jgi:predicted DNA-binding transcriptional regulator YafY
MMHFECILMGQRTSTETIIAIVQALLAQRTWRQADLARKAGVQVPALRKRLNELSSLGIPLTRDDDPPHVYWSVPQSWFPGGVLLAERDAQTFVRLLARLPKSLTRDRLLSTLLTSRPRGATSPPPIVTPTVSPLEETHLVTIEDAAGQARTLHMRYFSASRGSVDWRRVSVQRVLATPPARFLAVCHRSGTLKWFRLDNVLEAALDASEPFRSADADQIEEVLRTSLEGYRDAGAPVTATFFVRDPEARWVRSNLPAPMTVEPVSGGMRVSAETGALLPLARFVVGLGGAARAETPDLRALVLDLARGALTVLEA